MGPGGSGERFAVCGGRLARGPSWQATDAQAEIYDMNKLLKAGHRVPRQYREDSYLLEIWITRERFR